MTDPTRTSEQTRVNSVLNRRTVRNWTVLLLLALAPCLVFWRVASFDFLNFDDQRYVASNMAIQRGLSGSSLAWAFQTFYASNWHPLTWISHMMDIQLFGLDAGWHHVTNLLLHIANTLLLWLALRRLTNTFWRSTIVAALFAVHPLHVESVAWVAERKDVLSTFFFMLTLWGYARYAEQRSQVRGRKTGTREQTSESERTNGLTWQGFNAAKAWYFLTLLFFALGLMSKPMLVTIPFLLLLLDYWPLRRFDLDSWKSRFKGLMVEKLPFVALAAASSVVTFVAQKSGGSVATLDQLSLDARVSNALMAYFGYIQKLLWPSKLAILYLPPAQWPDWGIVAAALTLIILSAAFLRWASNRPYLAVGWLWFLGTLIPVIGLVQVGSQYMADRYTYIPLIGCFVGLVWGIADLVVRFHLRKTLIGIASLLLIGTLSYAAHRQVRYWRDGETVFRRCLEVTLDNYVAHNNLAAALVAQRKYEEAKSHYIQALTIHPFYADALRNLGTVLAMQGDFSQAEVYLRKCVEVAPESAEAQGKLGLALAEQGRIQDAVACYRESLRLEPRQMVPCNNLAWILATSPDPQLRNGQEAVQLALRACELTGYNQVMLIGTLAAAYAEAGEFREAVKTAEMAVARAEAEGQTELALKNRQLLEVYRSGKAYHESASAPGQ